MKRLILLLPLLTACATPPVVVYQDTAGRKITYVGESTFLEKSDYEKHNDAFLINDGNLTFEYRRRSEKNAKDQTSVPNTYIGWEGTKFLSQEATKATGITADRDVALGAQNADVAKTKLTPTVIGPEETAVFAP